MARLSPKRIFVLLLAVFVTTGASLSVVQAGNMAATMSMATDNAAAMTVENGMVAMADMQAAPGGDCKACIKHVGDNGKLTHCPPTCIAPALAMLPSAAGMVPVLPIQQPSGSSTPRLDGRNFLPDPSPPRSSDLV